ncbi:hypothetical protein D3C87_1715700 [compost metagenome]
MLVMLGILCLGSPSAVADEEKSLQLYAGVTLTQGFPRLAKQFDHLSKRSLRQTFRFKDGILTYDKSYVDAYDTRFAFTFKKPAMSLSEARGILRILQTEPVDLARPEASKDMIRYQGTVWEETGDSTAKAEIRLSGGKAHEVRYLKDQSTP